MINYLLVALIFSMPALSSAKTVLSPRPFLAAEVFLYQDDAENIPLKISTTHPYYGARSKKSAVNVKLTADFSLENKFLIKLAGINRGPWNRWVNAAMFNDNEVKIGFPLLKSGLVGKGLIANDLEVIVNFKEICEQVRCDFKKGEYIYFFLDDFLGREIKPIYEWDHVIGVYYLFKR
ncbi:MAG: hypothetical protein CME61_02000 [Halobacteriovoraceae bacterium]|nr:hypothetical protein [Halobacteriovoraceae bacterium]